MAVDRALLTSWFAASGSPSPADVVDLTRRFVNPNKVELFASLGLRPIMTERRGYEFWDGDGRRLFDAHLNGGTYNLGHRNPELVATLRDALGSLDIGNHHFLSGLRGRLAEDLVASAPGPMRYVVLCPSASEAIDVAVKSARHATGRRGVVSSTRSYHGAAGIALAAGDVRNASYFGCDGPPGEYVQVPFGDTRAIENAIDTLRPAAVVLETIPATAGFPLPPPEFFPAVRRACDRHGAALVVDEVQVGLARSGAMWAIEHEHVHPDALVTGKGLGGGLYPVGAAVLSEPLGAWLGENGWGHGTTGGGSELGCAVALKVLEILRRPGVRERAARTAILLAAGFDALRARHPLLREVRQRGLVVGLVFDHPEGGLLMTRAGYRHGLWAMFAGYDRSVLQCKPGLLLTDAQVDELLGLLDTTMTTVERELGT
jgi:acetylornithine/succinyldiaminopimelate/putrescine aminotransferase